MKVVGQLKLFDKNINACRDRAVSAVFAQGGKNLYLQV